MQSLKRLFLPEKAEAITAVSISIFLLCALNAKRFWLILGGDTVADASGQSSWDSILSNVMVSLDKYISPNFLDLVVWLIVGCLGFIVISAIIAAINTAESEANILHYYANPKGQRHEIIAFITKVLIRLVGLVGGLFWVIVFLKNVTPFCVKLFFTSITSIADYQSWLWAVLTVLIMAGSLYAFAILGRLIALKARIF